MSTTFREKVASFWKWFPQVAHEIGTSMSQGDNVQEAVAEFQANLGDKVGGLPWVFGPGEGPDRISFTLTGEGQVVRQLLTHYWHQNAVEVPGWDFYSSRQPSSLEQLASVGIQIGDSSVNAEDLQIAPEVDLENQVISIRAWHEAFEYLDEEGRLQILYLLLDEALGEFGTQMQLGNMEFEAADDSMPLTEFPTYVQRVCQENDWSQVTPLERYSGYRMKPSNEFERADTIAGHTCIRSELFEFLGNGGEMEEDPLEGTGAELIYVKIDQSVFPEGQEMERRDELENKICDAMKGHGYPTGGATGVEYSYIDLVIFDGDNCKQAIRDALNEIGLEGQFSIKPFVR